MKPEFFYTLHYKPLFKCARAVLKYHLEKLSIQTQKKKRYISGR
jgi:hypothetical protein